MNRVENITIVGGGTAGWLSAAMLGTFLNERRSGPWLSRFTNFHEQPV